MSFPEGYVILAILFLFPFLLARKNVFDLEKIIHSYMADSEKILLKIIDRFLLLKHHATTFYKHHILQVFLKE